MSLKRICDWLLRKLYPPRCIFCSRVLNDSEKLHICRECAVNVKKISVEHCPVCGRESGLGAAICWQCSLNKIPFKIHRSVYVYRDKARRAVVRLKFYNKPHYADTMGQIMSVYAPKTSDIDIVTYVPMTKRAMRKRGYNQAQLMAEKIAELVNVECVCCLEKVRETKVQSTLDFKRRQKNIAGAFRGLDNAVGKRILLVDDVYTTGATISEASKALKRAGASDIYCITFAMTQRKTND